jgi:succinoglycan biosynthesis transport protein ExoP
MKNSMVTIDDPHPGLQQLTVLDLWETIKDRKSYVIATLLVAIGVAALFGIFGTRQYQAQGEIQIQKDSTDALGLDSMMSGAAGGASDALDANITIQTQAKILESQTLALTVIDNLRLEKEPDFKPKFSLIGWATGWMSPKGPSDPHGASLGDSPSKRERLVHTFEKNLKVKPVSGTRLIDVTYTSTDPKLAAAIINQLIEGLIDYNFQTRYTATSQTSDWLGKQLSELRTSSDDLQRQVADLQRSSQVFSFGGEDLAGKSVIYSSVLDQLQQTTVNMTQAQSNRILKGAIYQAVKSGNPEALATLAATGATGGSPAVGNSLALLQSLRAQEATQKASIGETAAKFGPAYPRLDEMQANLTSLEGSITDEQDRLEKRTRSDYEIAQQVEDHTREIFDQQKKSAEALNDKAIQYQVVRQEADQSRDLYARLQSKLKEAGVLEGLKSSNITVVEPGRVPSRPTSPNPMLLLAGSLFGGSFLGLGLAWGADVIDGKVRKPEVMSGKFGHAYFGHLPFETTRLTAEERRSLPTPPIFSLTRPQSSYSEALRSLRTALMLSGGGGPPQVLLVTSPAPREGKSTVSVNLAVQMAQQGRRVLLVDADLRRPTLHHALNQMHPDGLTTLLDPTSNMDPALTHPVPGVPGLFFMPAGPVVMHPAEMLGSDRFRQLLSRWRETFDCIILDTPPVMAVTDSVLLAPLADQVILVARYQSTETTDLKHCFRLLRMRAPETPTGVLLNGVKRTRGLEYYGYAALPTASAVN